MALNKPVPSQDTWWALSHIPDFLHPGDSYHHPLVDLKGPLYTHEVYTIGLRDLADSGLEKAKRSCWRFAAGSSIGPAVGGEVSTLSQHDVPRLTGLMQGPELTAVLAAAESVEKLAECQSAEDCYDLRILNIPGLVMEAFWLHGTPKQTDTNGKKAMPDLIVPFLTASKKIERLRKYTLSEFLEKVTSLAKQQLEWEGLTEVDY